MKEAVEIIRNDPAGNRDLLTTLSQVKDVFAGDARPGVQRVAAAELTVMSLSNVVERLQDEMRSNFNAARGTEGRALRMVTGLV